MPSQKGSKSRGLSRRLSFGQSGCRDSKPLDKRSNNISGVFGLAVEQRKIDNRVSVISGVPGDRVGYMGRQDLFLLVEKRVNKK